MDQVKPTLVLDVDGVILNFCKPFALWWNETYGLERGKISDNPISWDMGWTNKADPSKTTEIIHLTITEFLMTGPMFELMEPEIPEIIKRLHEKYRIHLVTAFNVDFAFLREENLKRFDIEYDEITYVDGHKTEAIEKIKPFAVVEDSPKHVEAITKLGYKVFAPNFWNYVNNLIRPKIFRNVDYYNNWTELEKKIHYTSKS